jgi:hypothetical protein
MGVGHCGPTVGQWLQCLCCHKGAAEVEQTGRTRFVCAVAGRCCCCPPAGARSVPCPPAGAQRAQRDVEATVPRHCAAVCRLCGWSLRRGRASVTCGDRAVAGRSSGGPPARAREVYEQCAKRLERRLRSAPQRREQRPAPLLSQPTGLASAGLRGTRGWSGAAATLMRGG